MKINNTLRVCMLLGGLTAPISVWAAGVPVEDLTQQESSGGASTYGAGDTPSFQPVEEQPAQQRSAPPPSSYGRPASPPTSAPIAVDLATRIDRLQSEVDRLRGQVEVQDNTIKRLNEQLRAQYQDLDQRLQGQTTAPKKPAPAMAPPTKPIPAKSTNPKASPDDNIADPDANAVADAPNPSVTKAPVDTQAEKQDYDAAIALLKKQDYVRATTQLQRYLRDYPKGKYTASSHYWLGKIYSYQGQPDLAIAEYNTVINNYPTDPKMPNALLELGIAYDEAGDWEQAKTQLNKVVKLFPKTETAQKAEARLQKIKRQGL